MPRKKKRRIMSIDELYIFCLKNNFAHFSSDKFGKELMVRMDGKFEKTSTDEDKHKESLTPFVSRAFHDHVNLNKSNIPEESFSENLPSANFRPILAHITTNSDNELDFGSHDYYITFDEDGNDKVIYEEQPVGVIDGSKTTIEYDEEAQVNRAVLHGYLYDEYCQDAIDILNRRGTVDCSVELSIRELSFDVASKTLSLDDFYVSGLTLLSKDIMPGMQGSNFKIEDFAVDNNNSIKFNKDEKLIELLDKLNDTLSNFNKYSSEKGGNTQNMTIFEKLLKKYNKTIEDITFEYKDLSDDELTAKFAEVFDDGDGSGGFGVDASSEEDSDESGTNTPTDNTDNDDTEENNTDDITSDSDTSDTSSTSTDDEDVKKKKKQNNSVNTDKIVRTYEISHEDTRYALYQLLAEFEEADNEWYFINSVYDTYFTYENWNGDKIYGQAYIKDGDNVAFDGERYNLHRELLTDSEYAELQSMRSNYAALKEFKETAEKNELHAQKEKILNSEKYAVLAEKDEDGKYVNKSFAKLVSEMGNYSLTDLETQVKVIHSDYMTEHSNFSANTDDKKKTSSVKMFANPSKTVKTSRYGKLFKDKK